MELQGMLLNDWGWMEKKKKKSFRWWLYVCQHQRFEEHLW